MSENERMCRRCVMDTSDPDIRFDADGVCNHCLAVEERKKEYPYNLDAESKVVRLDEVILQIKSAGKGKRYDCVIGVSGGVDSTYVILEARRRGLRPLAVHLDNGWNSELAVHNIERMCTKLNVDLYTYVIDWDEFRDIQVSFLKASTPDSEIPTDHAITGILYRTAAEYGLKFIISGDNFNTESILPFAWSHGHNDWKYVRSVHKRFGAVPFDTFPGLSYQRLFYYVFIKRIRMIHLLDFVEFRKSAAIEILKEELDWEPYKGKHHESLYTKILQTYILPEKFGFDKRRAHLSSLICAGEITKGEALKEVAQELQDPLALVQEREYAAAKLGITLDEFQGIMELPPRQFWDYPSYENSWYFPIARKIFRVLKGKRCESGRRKVFGAIRRKLRSGSG